MCQTGGTLRSDPKSEFSETESPDLDPMTHAYGSPKYAFWVLLTLLKVGQYSIFYYCPIRQSVNIAMISRPHGYYNQENINKTQKSLVEPTGKVKVGQYSLRQFMIL